jgi:hypothetical protein
MLMYFPQIQRKTPLRKNKALQTAPFPLFSHNCPMEPSALIAELIRAVARMEGLWNCSFLKLDNTK